MPLSRETDGVKKDHEIWSFVAKEFHVLFLDPKQ